MPAATCLLGVYDPSSMPLPALDLAGTTVEAHLEAVGSDTLGRPLLDVTVDTSPATQALGLAPWGPATALQLHAALRSLTRKNPKAVGLRDRVGVVFADSWEPKPNVFGVMFDTGFEDSLLGSNKTYSAVAREGCAIFVGAIRRVRAAQGATDEQIRRQVVWTTLHEIGHLFNLWHRADPVRFMTPSDSAKIYDPLSPLPGPNGQPRDVRDAFDSEHRAFLTSCLANGLGAANAAYAWPGGTIFGTRGGIWPSETAYRDALEGPSSRLSLELRIELAQREAWPFDPLELDISLTVRGGRRKIYRLPDSLDPGYEHFALWIERPDGTRARYLSPRHYCENAGRLTVAAGQPFARDISVFGQSGGYTFTQSGPHSLFATWHLPSGRVLRSNLIDLLIKDGGRLRSDDEERRRVLELPAVAGFLYHRDFAAAGRRTKHAVEAVAELCGRTRDPRLQVDLSYALGRAYAQAAWRGRRGRLRFEEQAIRHLSRVADGSDVASPRRLFHARRLVDRLRHRG